MTHQQPCICEKCVARDTAERRVELEGRAELALALANAFWEIKYILDSGWGSDESQNAAIGHIERIVESAIARTGNAIGFKHG